MSQRIHMSARMSFGQLLVTTIVILLDVLFPTLILSQPLDLRFGHFTTENGLSQDVVTCLHRDKLGYLWIGTEDGLNRYDGYAIKSYKLMPEKGRELPNNTVARIDDFNEDNLLLAMGASLVLYDRAHDTLVRPSGALAPYSTREVTSIIHDQRGDTWFICEHASLVRYDPVHDSCRVFSFAENTPDAPFRRGILTAFADNYDSIWVGTDSALALFHRDTGEFEYFPLRNVQNDHPRYLFPSAITEDGAHDLWIGTQLGVYRFDRGQRIFHLVSFGGKGTVFPAQRDYIIGGLEWDRSGRLWMGGFSGLYCLDPRTGKGASYTQIENDRLSLLSSRIYALYCDPSNVLWVGTWHGGLNRVDFKEERFGMLRNSVATPLAGRASDVVAVCEDAAGNAWLASRAGGVTRIDHGAKTFTAFVHDPRRTSSIGKDEHSSLAPDADGSVWIASASELEHCDPKRGAFSRIRVPGVDGRKKIILKIFNDTRDRLWIGVEHFGALSLNKTTGEFTTYTESNADTVWRGFTGCWAFYEDREGNMWLGGWIGSLDLYCIQRSTNRVVRYRQPQLNTARSLAEDRDGNLWVGTWGQGLSRLDPRTGEVKQFTELDGLPNNFVKGLLIDDDGNLWISTEMGISRYSPSAGIFKNFDSHDGLQGNFFYTSSCWKGIDGTVYFGGVNGLNAFHPRNIRDEVYDPPVILTNFKVLDRNRREDQPLSRLTRAELSSSEDMFSIEYASLDLTAPERNHYAYKLDGFDREWINAGVRRFVSYTHLDPGGYLFQVKGTNGDGTWSTHIAQLRIIILPAFWQTWWFYCAMAFATGTALYGVYRYRLNKLLELEHTRAAIATDLHDDIGAALTGIALFSDLARNEISSDAPQAIGRLQRIAETSRSLLDRMNDIVWAINPENDSLEYLLLRMKEVAASLFDARGIEYEITMPGSIPAIKLPMTVRRNLFLVYKEIVHNIVRHSSATVVKIRVAFPGEQGSRFEVDVRDNGTGFDAALVKRGNGLNNIEQRSHSLHANLELISSPGNGTTVRLRFPFKSPV